MLFTMFASSPKIVGRQNLEVVKPPYIVACNHASILDPAMLLGFFPDPVRFMAKAELAEAPWIGFIEKRLGNIHVKRDGTDVGAIRKALTLLKEGDVGLVIFVEGGRTEDVGDLSEFKNGAAMLAARAGVPVITVYLQDTGKSVPPGAWVPRWCPLTMHIGAPVALDFEGRKPSPEALKQGSEVIRKAILALRPTNSQ